ncbi:MAG: thiolase family protein [Dehalococcoidia bacterium]|nr:MAG: thiolase family protein [Dehalococcoidia bacterium]
MEQIDSTIRGRTAIVGFAELPTQRTYPGRSTLSLFAEVARDAILDAGMRLAEIDGLITGDSTNSLLVAQTLGLTPRYTASMTLHGANGASAVATAAAAIAAGLATNVLCIFGESRPASSSRLNAEAVARDGGGPRTLASEWEAPYGPVIAANGGYGLMKQRHMFQYGTTQEQFAKCVVDERFNAVENANALWVGDLITIDDVLASRMTNDPLHLLEGVMPCSGANAAIVTSAERARTLPHPPVFILGVGGPVVTNDTMRTSHDITVSPTAIAAPLALAMAGYAPPDIEFVQFYDCYSIYVMMCIEDAGLCPKGEVGGFYQDTDTTYLGTFPINTDGGQIGGGQPTGAGGFRHVVEAARQIMRRGGSRQVPKADLCLVNGNGGIASVVTTLVLGSAATL